MTDVLDAKATTDLSTPKVFDPRDVAALRLNPAFPGAVRASTAMMVELYKGNRLLNAIVNDRGRLTLSCLALHLHFAGDPADPRSGLTAARMKAISAAEGFASPGRVSAILALMRWAGYLAPASASGDNHRLAATPAFIALHRDRWRRQLAVVATLLDEGRLGLDAMDRPGFTAAYAAAQARQFLSGFRLIAHGPALELFAERNCGLLLLASIIASGDADDLAVPARPVPISISALARRFGVSRPHVIALLRDAEAQGLLARVGPNGSQALLSRRLADDVEAFFAAVYLFHARSVRETLAVIDAG
jgi:hypothetical protein